MAMTWWVMQSRSTSATAETIGRSCELDGRLVSKYGRLVRPLRLGHKLLGRAREYAIRIDSSTVSHVHARITVLANLVIIEDLRSRNGTFGRGARIDTPIEIYDSESIRLGIFEMFFHACARTTEETADVREC